MYTGITMFKAISVCIIDPSNMCTKTCKLLKVISIRKLKRQWPKLKHHGRKVNIKVKNTLEKVYIKVDDASVFKDLSIERCRH